MGTEWCRPFFQFSGIDVNHTLHASRARQAHIR
jgi:hypothetical protein